MAGQNGGAAFILLFLVISVVVGVSMLVAEMLIGNRTQKNAQEAFYELDESEHKQWHWVGFTIIGGPIILTFYCIVLGWVVYYLGMISFNLPTNINDSKMLFGGLVQDFSAQLLSFGVVMALTAYFVAKGVKSGIEKLNFTLMPLLFIIFFGLLIYSMTLDSFGKSVTFMFQPDFSKITPQVFMDAMGQVFFSLSLGIGIIITYAAFTEKQQNLYNAAMWVLIPGIVISIVAGLMIFTFVFEYGTEQDVGAGAGLIFITLPVMFSHMGTLGSIICLLFMIGLGFAGLSSTISLLEPAVKWLEDKTGKNRVMLSWAVSLVVFIVGSILILSLNESHSELTLAGKSLFDWMDWISANVIMTLGGLLATIFVGYAIKKEHLQEWTKHYLNPIMFNFWYFAIRILAPLMVCSIFVYKIYDITHQEVAPEPQAEQIEQTQEINQAQEAQQIHESHSAQEHEFSTTQSDAAAKDSTKEGK